MREIVFDVGSPDILYAALQVGFVLKSAGRREDMETTRQGLDADVHAIVIDPKNSKRIFIASGGDSYAPVKLPDDRSTSAKMAASHGRPRR